MVHIDITLVQHLDCDLIHTENDEMHDGMTMCQIEKTHVTTMQLLHLRVLLKMNVLVLTIEKSKTIVV